MDSSAHPLDSLHAFRDSLYRCFDRPADALFELTDAILTAGCLPSPVHLSLAAVHRCDSDVYGSVRVRCWVGLHPKTRRIGERYGCERAPIVGGCVVLVEVAKLPSQTRKPKKLWLWCSGQSEAHLDLLWRSYWRLLRPPAHHPLAEANPGLDHA
jgi:hypothetical protein